MMISSVPPSRIHKASNCRNSVCLCCDCHRYKKICLHLWQTVAVRWGEGACQYCQCMQLRVCYVGIAAHYSGNGDCWKQNLVMVEWDILFYVDKKTESFSVNLKPLCQDLSKILCAAREVLLRLTNLEYLFILLIIKQKYEDNARLASCCCKNKLFRAF